MLGCVARRGPHTCTTHPRKDSLQRALFSLLTSSLARTLRTIPASVGAILTCSRARPSSAPSTCPRSQAFRVQPALSFTRRQKVCPAFFAHPPASSFAVLGRDEERPKQLRWLSYAHDRLGAAHVPTPTTYYSQPRKYLHPGFMPFHFLLLGCCCHDMSRCPKRCCVLLSDSRLTGCAVFVCALSPCDRSCWLETFVSARLLPDKS